MIIAYHVVFGCYGFWLPNDPRGSWSDFVRSFDLYAFGKATKIDTKQSVANQPHDAFGRLEPKRALRYPPVRLNGNQARCVAMAFGEQARKAGYRIHACCVMPDHVHLVIARHRYPIERVVNLLKGAATRRLRSECPDSHESPTPWSQGFWKVYLDERVGVERAIRYVRDNPVKAGLKAQRWSFEDSCFGD